MNLPNVVQALSYDEILEQNVAIVKELLPGYKPAEGDNVMLVLHAFTYRELHLRAYFNALAKAFFLSTASGSDLDNLAETLYGLYRLPGAKPYAQMEFSLTAPLTYEMRIAAGFELVDETGAHFAKLLKDVVIEAGATSATGVIELQEEMAASKVRTEIQVVPLPYVQVRQLGDFANGSDPESDDAFKKRIRTSFADRSTAGSAMTYRSFALGADERIEEVKVLSPAPGTVDVVYHSKDADDLMQARIEKALGAEAVRPLTDLVRVKRANEVRFDVSADLSIKGGTDAASVYVRAKESLEALRFGIGEDVSVARLIDALMVDGVADVTLSAPSQNIEIDDYSIAVLGKANITYKVAQ